MMKKIPDSENELKAAFVVFDADGDGTTSRSELKRIMLKFGQALSNAELDAVMAEVDKNGGKWGCCFIFTDRRSTMLVNVYPVRFIHSLCAPVGRFLIYFYSFSSSSELQCIRRWRDKL